jgi:hypothetical protein
MRIAVPSSSIWVTGGSVRHRLRFLAGPDVMRPCPDSDALCLAFSRSAHRTQKKSDGTTIIIEERRFEVPSRYRHLIRIEVRYALRRLESRFSNFALCSRASRAN